MNRARRQPVAPPTTLDPAILRIVETMARAHARRDFHAAVSAAPALPPAAAGS